MALSLFSCLSFATNRSEERGEGRDGELAIWMDRRGIRHVRHKLGELFCNGSTVSHCLGDCAEAPDELTTIDKDVGFW